MTDSGPASATLLAHLLFPVILFAIPSVATATLVGPGDIAFVRFNGEGNSDDFAIVLLADADMGQEVFFNTGTYSKDFMAISGGQSIKWNITKSLAAGTVVTFTDLNSFGSPAVSSDGMIAESTTRMMPLSETGETIYAYFGTESVPATFLAAITTEGSSVLTEADLVAGDTAVVLPNDIDEAHYVGARATESAFTEYRPLIGNVAAHWDVRLTDSEPISPSFDTTNFSLDTGIATPESPRVILLGLIALWGFLWTAQLRRPTPAE